jgi:hypothetical protein
MRVNSIKLLKTHVEKMPVFRLSTMLMKIKGVIGEQWRVVGG